MSDTNKYFNNGILSSEPCIVLSEASFKEVDDKTLSINSEAYCGFPRASEGAFPFNSYSDKGSFTDTSKYIPLYQSVLNLQQGKAISGSSSVNLVTDSDFDFKAGEYPDKNYRANDGLLSMDIADVSQMRRDLQNQIDEVKKQLKNADDKSALVEAREALKRGEKVADSVIVSMSDKSLADLLTKYNNTIQ